VRSRPARQCSGIEAHGTATSMGPIASASSKGVGSNSGIVTAWEDHGARENLMQCYFLHHISCINYPGKEPGHAT
jgi:hypothetical protein